MTTLDFSLLAKISSHEHVCARDTMYGKNQLYYENLVSLMVENAALSKKERYNAFKETFCKITDINVRLHMHNEQLFRGACAYGYMHIAKFLWNYSLNTPECEPIDVLNDKRIPIVSIPYSALIYNCLTTHVKMTNWLWSLIALHHKDKCAFYAELCLRTTTEQGAQVQCVQWALRLCKRYKASVCYNNIFRWSCVYNHLSVAKYLWEHTTVCLDGILEHVLFAICGKGNLDMLQWILDLTGNMCNTSTFYIPLYLKAGFERACVNNHVNVVEWLLKCTYLSVSILDAPFCKSILQIICKMQNNEWRIEEPNAHKKRIQIATLLTNLHPTFCQFQLENGLIVLCSTLTRLPPLDSLDMNIKECSICHDSMSSVQTKCFHQFCYPCIQSWYQLQTNPTCPYCRNPFDCCHDLAL